jgi:subtilisin family serine protease
VKINPKSRPTWGRALLLLPAITALGSCTDRDPVRPDAVVRLASVAPAGAAVERGCARFEVRVSGRDRIQVVPDTSVQCGPVQPVLSGEPAFDVTRKLIRLPVALENRGQRKLKVPARLYGWEDSLVVVSPPGLSGNRHESSYIDFVSPDSTSADSSAVLAWRYDEQLPGAGVARILAAGQRSGMRWIEISAHPGVEVVRITFQSSARRASPPVPAAAPDTIPEGLYGNPAQILSGSPYFSLSDKVLKNVVSIRFEDGTPQAVRQEAVDAVGGELIGGQPFPGMEGYYLIHVEDDGTGKQMREAIDRLNATPGVATAEPEYLFDPGERDLWLKPKDDGGGDWSNEWQLDPVKADGKNWALEAISAPLAWGCSTGDAGTKVAVIDNGFLSHPDLTPNIAYAVDLDRYSGLYRKNDHGTRVASIIGAKGNNHQGISGVMWNAGLMLMEDSEKGISDFGDIVRALRARFFGPMPDIKIQRLMMQQALDRGTNVVNISSGTIGVSKKTDVPLEKRIGDIMVDVNEMKYILQKSSNKALVVIAAGNEARVDAAWSGYPILAAELPDQVIAVGAVSGVGDNYATAWSKSAINSQESPFPARHRNLIQIYAPGENVAVLAEGAIADWSISASNGTSMAAPMVAGVAGLLKSFDPSLTSKEIKDLLIRGSQNAGRIVVGGGDGRQAHLVNAYESLRLAAERKGAPLCGNRVWLDGNDLVIQRGKSKESPTDRIPDAVTGFGAEVQALHGGRRIQVYDGATFQRYVWVLRDGTWQQELMTTFEFSGPTRSSYRSSHDGDAYTYLSGGQVFVRYRSESQARNLGKLPIRESATGKYVCTRRWNQHWNGSTHCTDSTFVGSTVHVIPAGPAFSPANDRILVSIHVQSVSIEETHNWYRCLEDWLTAEGYWKHLECQDIVINTFQGSTGIFSYPMEGGGPISLFSVSGRVYLNSMSEDGKELYLQRTLSAPGSMHRWTWQWNPLRESDWGQSLCKDHPGTRLVMTGCYTAFYQLYPPPVKNPIIPCVGEFFVLGASVSTLQTPVHCDNRYGDNQGTFAPDRIPTIGTSSPSTFSIPETGWRPGPDPRRQ